MKGLKMSVLLFKAFTRNVLTTLKTALVNSLWEFTELRVKLSKTISSKIRWHHSMQSSKKHLDLTYISLFQVWSKHLQSIESKQLLES